MSVFRGSVQVPELSPRPAVYVASARTEQEAREIHKNVWNLGNAPFLIVLIPHQVRVYKGFGFSQRDEEADIIAGSLEDFHAREIDSGRIWTLQAANLKTDARVDRRLLKNLSELGDKLTSSVGNLNPRVAHALIGKYIYISYLRHRGILSDEWLAENGVNLEQVLSRNATCSGLLSLVNALETRFNGRIFPLDVTEMLDNETVAFVASIFRGDEAVSGQLAFDFQVYDFSHIPIETLSLIYEQFLHREDASKPNGAYYTPEPLADYLLASVNEARPLSPTARILDPCCGSGVFLVLAYRKLINEEVVRQAGKELSADELKAILEQRIYGVELHEDACYVAEFSLLLTLLSCVDPPDLHHNKDFKFPELHNSNIFHCDFFDDESKFWQKNLKFDWVVGNPPWFEIEVDPDDSDCAKNKKDENALRWIRTASQSGRPIARNRICDAFAWRVADVLKPDGYAGLVIHATTLTNDHCAEFRRQFFTANSVAAVTNFANLFEVLFDKRARVEKCQAL